MIVNKSNITKVSTELLDFNTDIESVFTENLTGIFSIKYQEGDRYVNEWTHLMSSMGTVLTQIPDDLYVEERIEKQLFAITCPSITDADIFYNESLGYYTLFHSFYNVPNILELLQKSVKGLIVGIFYNNKNSHFFCFFKQDYSDFTFEATDKLKKNFDLIRKMSLNLWHNETYKLRKDTLQVGGVDFQVNGGTLTLDIVTVLDLATVPRDFSVSPTSGLIILHDTEDFIVTVAGDLDIASIEVYSSNPWIASAVISGNIITVTGEGVKSGDVGLGSAIVTVVSREIDKTIDLDITVTRAPDFRVSPTSGIVYVGFSHDFIVTVKWGLNIDSISAVSSDTNVATTVVAGDIITVTGVAVGEAIVTVASSDIAKTIDLHIRVNSATFTVSPTSAIVYAWFTQDFIVGVFGSLNIDSISAVSSDTNVATTVLAGDIITVTGVAVGEAIVTVASSDIAETIDLPIFVQDIDFSVSPTSAYVYVGGTKDFIVTVRDGFDIDSISIDAVSSDTNVATAVVSSDMYSKSIITVTGVTVGEAIVNVTCPDIDKTIALYITVQGDPDFSVTPTSAVIPVGDTKDFIVTVTNGLNADSISALSSDTNVATTVVSGDIITVTGVTVGEAIVNVASPDIDKTQQILVSTDVPSSATFKATNVVNILVPTKTWVSLDTLTNELTLDDPNGANIILAGWVVSVNSLDKTSVIRYLQASYSNYSVSFDASTYKPVIGDAFNLKNGVAVSPGTGYEVPDCTVASDGYGGIVYVDVAVTASDIATLEQHKIS